jgi:hypothetical protein
MKILAQKQDFRWTTECSDTFLVVLVRRMEIDVNSFCAELQRLLCCSRNKIRHGIFYG